MALRRIAVLTYDKRGVGQSGGRYEGVDNVSAANLELLASDAAAAMKWVSKSPRVQSLPRGFVGISQAGWVVPLALSRSPAIDFLGFWSGPTCTTSEQLHFQHSSAERESSQPQVAGNNSLATGRVEYRPDDVDPLSRLTSVSVPGLWLFGGKDPYVPINLSTRRLQELIDKGRRNLQYRVFPEEGHNLADSPKQPSFVTMVEWIEGIALSRP
jgi:pimeloyl-ACP methyl ester carboxylesterase